MQGEPVHRTILTLDVEGSTRPERRDSDRLQIRSVLHALVERGLDRAGIRRGDWERTDQGDGVLVLVKPDVPKTRVLPWLILRLAAGLDRYNLDAPPSARLRVRVVVHAGEVARDAHGYAGSALNLAFRLLDSDVLRQHLAEAGGSLALLISDSIYRDIVQQGFGNIDTGAFRQVHVTGKNVSTPAWVCVPEARGRCCQSRRSRGSCLLISPTSPGARRNSSTCC